MHCQNSAYQNKRNTATPEPNSPKRDLALPKLHTPKHSKLSCAPAALWITSPLPCFAHKTKLNHYISPQCQNSTHRCYAFTKSDYAMPWRNKTFLCLYPTVPTIPYSAETQHRITDASRSLHCPCFASPNHSPQLLDCSEHINAYTGHFGTLPIRDPTIPCRNIEGRCITEPKPGFSVLYLCLALLFLAGAVKCFTLHSQYWTLPDPNGA